MGAKAQVPDMGLQWDNFTKINIWLSSMRKSFYDENYDK